MARHDNNNALSSTDKMARSPKARPLASKATASPAPPVRSTLLTLASKKRPRQSWRSTLKQPRPPHRMSPAWPPPTTTMKAAAADALACGGWPDDK